MAAISNETGMKQGTVELTFCVLRSKGKPSRKVRSIS